jgi:hypothetical protein
LASINLQGCKSNCENNEMLKLKVGKHNPKVQEIIKIHPRNEHLFQVLITNLSSKKDDYFKK